MKKYWLHRLLLIPLTLFGIVALNFALIQMTPGGPVEHVMMKLQQGSNSAEGATLRDSKQSAMTKQLRTELEKQFGFDKPALHRFGQMLKNYLTFDFGKSFYQDKTVIQLIKEKMPVSISLGVFSTLLIYLIAIPLGIKKATKADSSFDKVTTGLLTIGYAVPSFLLAILLVIFFAGGHYLGWFPLRGLISDNWEQLSFFGKITDYLWHITLPVLAISVGGIAGLCFLTKNSFLDELGKAYVVTAKAKGCSSKRILYGHVFRNAMLLVLSGFPAMLIGMLFTGSVLIEVIFSLDGLGLLGYEAIQNRDYPVVFGTLYLFSLLGLLLNVLSDFIYTLVDPRIHFGGRRS
ncbi:MAG: microcin C ABC transporter permease YejB [Alphaproteobacteria bacterium]|nr:microcin C ABC transporter permease YejB [Alphaproteobacteria bacterium]